MTTRVPGPDRAGGEAKSDRVKRTSQGSPPGSTLPTVATVPGGATTRSFGPMSAPRVQRLGRMIGNKWLTTVLGKGPAGLQRIPIAYPDVGETLYEDPEAGGTKAAQKQFLATSYGTDFIKYEMVRNTSEAVVTVKIHFLDQKRGENKWLKDKWGQFVTSAGKKVGDPTFARDIGTPGPIPAGDKRQDFAKEQCAKIADAWNRYDLVAKMTPKAPAPATGETAPPAPKPVDVKLPLRFVAEPDFAASSPNAHAEVRLFGMGVVADREGAHPIDAGHWYMDTETNYGGMDITSISAHEYGHLIGLADEYSRSDDQTHQMLHRMGGGAKNADKALDQHTLKIMITAALYPAIEDRMWDNIEVIQKAYDGVKATLQQQLAGAVKSAWADPLISDTIVKQILPALKHAGAKARLPAVVTFQTGRNLSNVSRAADALAVYSGNEVAGSVLDLMMNWQSKILGAEFVAEGGDKSAVKISTEVSENITTHATSGPGAKAGAGLADTMIGGASLPKLGPSTTLLAQLEALPADWKVPGKGLDTAYTAGVIAPTVQAAVDGAIATGVIPKVKSVAELYVRIRNLVQSTSKASARKAVREFVTGQVRPKVMGQLETLGAQIDNEVNTALGMKAGAAMAKAPPDANVQAVASKLAALLKTQQNPKAYDKAADINPGATSPGMDVRHTASTMMGTNVMGKEGHRADMIEPVVSKFNTNLKKKEETDFTAKVTR